MILPDAPWVLPVAIALLYLYDSAQWLFHDEVVLEARGRGYRVSGGSVMEFARRHLYLPHPFFPHRPLLRLGWPHGGAAGWRPARWTRSRLALKALAPWTWLLWGLFFIVLPPLLVFGTEVMLLAWLVLAYLGIIAMLLRVHRYRKLLGLTPKAMASLACDALLCAPFALNTLRKISLGVGAGIPLRGFAGSMLSTAERATLVELLEGRIRSSLDHLDPASEAASTLRVYLESHRGDAT